MEKFIKQLLVFGIFTVASYFVLLVFWGEFVPAAYTKNLNYSLGAYGHMYTRTREAEKHEKVDILFIGSSHAYRGFDTRIAASYGYKSFNLGSSAQTPVQTKLLLDQYLDQLSPKILIYEVYPYTFTNDGVESSLDIIANDRIDWNALQMAFTINNIKTYNSLAYGCYRKIFNRDKKFTENTVIAEDRYIPGGFVERKITANGPVVNGEKKAAWQPKDYQLNAFEKIIELVKKKGIKLMLVQAPVTSSAFAMYTDNNKIDSFFSKKATYYNFNKLLSLSDSAHFYNKDHLNQVGVKIFNDSLFIKLLKK